MKAVAPFALATMACLTTSQSNVQRFNATRAFDDLRQIVAIGARPADVLAGVMRETMAVVGAGVLLGVPAALASAQVLEAMVFELSPYDPASVVSAVVLMLGVAGTAAFGPARRASRVDPSIALRAE